MNEKLSRAAQAALEAAIQDWNENGSAVSTLEFAANFWRLGMKFRQQHDAALCRKLADSGVTYHGSKFVAGGSECAAAIEESTP